MTVEELYFALKVLRAEGKGHYQVFQYLDTGEEDYTATVDELGVEEKPPSVYFVGDVE